MAKKKRIHIKQKKRIKQNNLRQQKGLHSILESRFINHTKSANIDMFNRLEF